MKKRTIKYYSTNLKAPEISFREALLRGLAPDGGLYMPISLPEISQKEINGFHGMEYHEIAFAILSKIIGNETDETVLKDLCKDAYNFEIPLEKIFNRNYIMRLDRGPTASFKDFAARMMSRLMQYYLSIDNKHVTILTATSGDTGSAVASAFYGLKNINAIILYPEKEVTSMQRKQMTTLAGNIKVIAIDGKFDDCQRLVKTAFLDKDLNEMSLTSANSINIGRLLPQSVYYFYAYSKLSVNFSEGTIFSVPSGNFGNLMGGIIARQMGLPVKKFIISTNSNDEVPEFLRSGTYNPVVPSKNCISSAMNVGHPSNLARIVAIYGGIMNETGDIIKMPDMDHLREDFYAVSVSDDETKMTISEIYKRYNTIIEPHGAVAWKGLKEFSKLNGKQLCISLETAHPAKFPDEIFNILGITPDLPVSLSELESKKEYYTLLENDYLKLREFILKNG